MHKEDSVLQCQNCGVLDNETMAESAKRKNFRYSKESIIINVEKILNEKFFVKETDMGILCQFCEKHLKRKKR